MNGSRNDDLDGGGGEDAGLVKQLLKLLNRLQNWRILTNLSLAQNRIQAFIRSTQRIFNQLRLSRGLMRELGTTGSTETYFGQGDSHVLNPSIVGNLP